MTESIDALEAWSEWFRGIRSDAPWWMPKEGDYVVDGLGRVSRCSVAEPHGAGFVRLDDGAEWLEGGGAYGYRPSVRPATIDEIPGNTSEEWRHDRALGVALGVDFIGGDTLPSIIDWQYLEGMGYLR